MEKKLRELKNRLQEINDLNKAASIMYWDQTTYMPAGSAATRGRQMATIGRFAHEKFVDPALGHLLDLLQPYAESLPYDSDDASLIRVTRRDYEKAIKVPPSLKAKQNENGAASFQAWTQARPNNDFAAVLPYLEKTLDLSRRYANCFPGYDHIADPLIDEADEGMDIATIDPYMDYLRTKYSELYTL